MTTALTAPEVQANTRTPRIALDRIDVAENVRELDPAHVEALAASIRLRGVLSPVTLKMRPDGIRALLVAGAHRLAAADKAGLTEIPYTLAPDDRTSADRAIENIARKNLTPLGEARAVQGMLDEGYTFAGISEHLGWPKRLVTARAKILELPELAQALIDNGTLPVSLVDALHVLATRAAPLCDALMRAIADNEVDAASLIREPGWTLSRVMANHKGSTFIGAFLGSLHKNDVAELKLGKKTTELYERAEALQRDIDRFRHPDRVAPRPPDDEQHERRLPRAGPVEPVQQQVRHLRDREDEDEVVEELERRRLLRVLVGRSLKPAHSSAS